MNFKIQGQLRKSVAVLLSAATLVSAVPGNVVYAAPNDEKTDATEVKEKTPTEKLQENQSKLAEISNSISENIKDLEDLNKKIENSNKEIKETELVLEETKESVTRLKEVASNNARAMQLNPQPMATSLLHAVTSGKNIIEMFNLVIGVNQIVSAQNDSFEMLKEKQDEVEKKEAFLKKESEELKKNEKEARERSEKLEKEKKESEKEIKKLQKEIEEADRIAAASIQTASSNFNFADSPFSRQFGIETSINVPAQATEEADVKVNVSITESITPTVEENRSYAVVEEAFKYLGVPYVWGGKTPSGFDCSGFTTWVFNHAVGLSMPSYTVSQEAYGQSVGLGELIPGDLLFWGGHGSTYHVAIYVGQGQYIHAPTPGQSVKLTSLSDWTPNFAKRVL